MWDGLTIIQLSSAAPDRPGNLWRTCLRQLLFLPPDAKVAGELVGAVYSGRDAYRFLVEVCGGLHSPLLGETEVFGQFRKFRGHATWEPRWNLFFDRVEEDVRELRRSQLHAVGSQSYGSLVRKMLPKGKDVILVGGGSLAQEILPWLEACSVSVVVRNPLKLPGALREGKNVSIFSFAELDSTKEKFRHSAWIVAAPVENARLVAYWSAHDAHSVIDLRQNSGFSGRALGFPYRGLADFFASLELLQKRQANVRASAFRFVGEIIRKREGAIVHRPYGWEDLAG